jgi:stage V sporulation protein D (sporulation-specific penicillin-binding protein)
MTKEGKSLTSKKVSSKLMKKRRLALVYFVVLALFIGLISRLIYVMVFDTKKLRQVASSQWTSKDTLGAKRGNILDRNGNELAISADVYRVDFDLTSLRTTLKDKKIDNNKFASDLASILNIKQDEVLKALNRTLDNGLPASWAPLKRRVEKSEADSIKALKIFGILVSSDSKRFYPSDNFIAHVIGHIDEDGKGVSGVEAKYDKELSGEKGYLTYERDSASNQLFFEDSRYTKPVDGKNIVLTIDEAIQNFAEQAAEKALVENKAKGVSIMIMNPKNGEVLAMVSKPDYNPNTPRQGAQTNDELFGMWKNRPITSLFEPGSIMKVITAAAAMEYGTVKDSDKFLCNGSLKVANRTIRCANTSGHGVQTFSEILQNSCNVGFMLVGQKLGKENLNTFIQKMGFGQKTGIDLPGEESGIVLQPKNMSEVDLATESFGQSISITQVQYMAAFNAVANGGTWIKPHIMKSISSFDEDGKLTIDKNFDDFQRKQVLDTKLTETLRGYLEKVVSKGVGSNAYIEEYKIGGKTGTAEKVENGVYKDKKYISSFAGLAPYDDPKITMIITVDEPDESKYYAGQTAAPVAKELFNNIFNYLAVNSKVLN